MPPASHQVFATSLKFLIQQIHPNVCSPTMYYVLYVFFFKRVFLFSEAKEETILS